MYFFPNRSYLRWCLILVRSDLCLCSFPVCSSSSSVSWPSLQRSGCSTTTSHHGPLSWATASGCLHSSVCLLIWSSTCSMPREHSNRYSMSCLFSLCPSVSSLWFPSFFHTRPSPSYLRRDLCSLTDISPTTGIASVPFLSMHRQGLPSAVSTWWLEIRIKGARRRHRPEIKAEKKRYFHRYYTHMQTRTVGYYRTTDSPLMLRDTRRQQRMCRLSRCQIWG